MEVEYDADKRDQVLAERGLDMADVGKVFEGFHLTRFDEKHSDNEDRYHSIGMLADDVVIVTWTQRSDLRRIITMWKANERERRKYHEARERLAGH